MPKKEEAKLRLHALNAIERDVRGKSQRTRDNLHKIVQKPELFSGAARVYTPLNDDGVTFPNEEKQVQASADQLLHEFADVFGDMWNNTLQRDITNCDAKADVIVDDKTIMKDVPVSFLLAFEKQLQDFRTVLRKMPITSTSYKWNKDKNDGLLKTEPIETTKTEKQKKAITIFEPTEHQKGVYEMDSKDVVIGTWKTTYMSGAMPPAERQRVLRNIDKMIRAVTLAREEANQCEVAARQDVGKTVFEFILGAE